jgi:hypothetical protein
MDTTAPGARSVFDTILSADSGITCREGGPGELSGFETGLRRNAVESAYHAVALTEQAYFFDYGKYTDDYNELVVSAGLTIDRGVCYWAISLATDPGGDPGFRFKVRHWTDPAVPTYDYDSLRSGDAEESQEKFDCVM